MGIFQCHNANPMSVYWPIVYVASTGLGITKPGTGLGLGLGTGLGTGLQLGQQQQSTGLGLGGLSQARCKWEIPCWYILQSV